MEEYQLHSFRARRRLRLKLVPLWKKLELFVARSYHFVWVGLAIWEKGSLGMILTRKMRNVGCTSESSSAAEKFPASMQTRRSRVYGEFWPVLVAVWGQGYGEGKE